jgi:hypothetical protein
MSIKPDIHHFNRELTLWRHPHSSLSFPSVHLSSTWQDEQLMESRLTFEISLDLYHQIDTQALFNLKPEIRGSFVGDFQPDATLKIETTLKPDRLPDLVQYTTSEAAAHYLLKVSQDTPDHPLLHTENWLALSVTQQQASGEVGYTTLWATLNPAALAAGTLSEADITQALTQFFSDWTTANLGTLTEKATAQILDEVGNFFNDLADTSIDAFAELSTELAQATPTPSSDTLLSQIITFFTEDDWSFTKLQGEPALRMAFQGKNGEWACYARAREEQQQFVFYSICPITAPEDNRQAIAEFLTRANYGMTIGNFELDYTDGEIRYKTSIDVEGDKLTPALIKNLVYTNVTMMDEYLPGIRAVIEQTMPPIDAIQMTEGKVLQ